jgi:hypothetical protein
VNARARKPPGPPSRRRSAFVLAGTVGRGAAPAGEQRWPAPDEEHQDDRDLRQAGVDWSPYKKLALPTPGEFDKD